MTSPIDLLTRLKAQIEKLKDRVSGDLSGLRKWRAEHEPWTNSGIEYTDGKLNVLRWTLGEVEILEKSLTDLAEAVRQDHEDVERLRGQRDGFKDIARGFDKDLETAQQRVQALAAELAALRTPEAEGMPTEAMNLWRLLKQIQGWSVSVIFHAGQAQRGRRMIEPDELMAIGRRLDKATDLAFQKLEATRKEIDPDF